ncbi:hypothetical protein [Parabacteroides merdae]|jgi:hypothetical protein|uniref:hypothetical protein n=1 Tax=Parabacteroides merdae TaxID=46503 RepID=UPI0034A4862A
MDIILTIQIIPVGDAEQRKQTYQTLNSWRQACMSMSNITMLHLLTQENVANMIYLQDHVKVRLGSKGDNAIFKTSRINATYNVLNRHDVPSDIITNVNMRVINHFQKNKEKIFKGITRIPYYQNNAPVPFSKQSITFVAEKGTHRIYKFKLFKKWFSCVIGKDNAGYVYRLDGILDGNIQYHNPQLYYNRRKKKWFLLLPIPAEEARPDINRDLVCYADLSTEIPIMASFGDECIQIGSAEEFLYRRRQLNEKLKRLQMDTRFSRGGHGRGQKLQAIDRYHKKERNYVHDKLHKYSAMLIGNCVRRGYGTVHLRVTGNGTNTSETEKDDRYWSSAELKKLILYKSKLNNIQVVCT